jgi:hypothetical protein
MTHAKLTSIACIAVSMLLGWGLTLSAAASGPSYVAPSADCGTAVSCYATLQSAIDAVQPGDEIRVAQDRQQRMGKGTNQFWCEGSGLVWGDSWRQIGTAIKQL